MNYALLPLNFNLNDVKVHAETSLENLVTQDRGILCINTIVAPFLRPLTACTKTKAISFEKSSGTASNVYL